METQDAPTRNEETSSPKILESPDKRDERGGASPDWQPVGLCLQTAVVADCAEGGAYARAIFRSDSSRSLADF
jgi:hypothetical protein